jgi:hypothetical protein
MRRQWSGDGLADAVYQVCKGAIGLALEDGTVVLADADELTPNAEIVVLDPEFTAAGSLAVVDERVAELLSQLGLSRSATLQRRLADVLGALGLRSFTLSRLADQLTSEVRTYYRSAFEHEFYHPGWPDTVERLSADGFRRPALDRIESLPSIQRGTKRRLMQLVNIIADDAALEADRARRSFDRLEQFYSPLGGEPSGPDRNRLRRDLQALAKILRELV